MSQFIDFYEDLQVSSKADKETIERIYRMLAKRYHPDNPDSGDPQRFNIISTAYETLSNAQKRAAYDVKYDQFQTRRWNINFNTSTNQNNKDTMTIRDGILAVLLHQRKQDPSSPSIGLWHLEKMVGWPEKILEFHIWYLKEKSWIQRSDSGQYMITAEGVDRIENMQFDRNNSSFFIENKPPTPRDE